MGGETPQDALLPDPERFRAILDHSPAVIYVKDLEGRYLLVNRRYEILFHVGRGAMVGKTDADLFPAEIAQAFQANDREVLKAGEPREWEEIAPQDDGNHTYLSLKFPLFDASGVPIAVCGISTDITERKRAQARRALQAALREDVSLALGRAEGLLRDVLQGCAEALVRRLGAALARIWTLDEDRGDLAIEASAGLYTHLDGPHARIAVGSLRIGRIAEERKALLSNDVATDPRVGDRDWAEREGIVAFAGHPLIVEGKLVGVMAMFAREALDEETLESLAAVADAVAQGVVRKRLEVERAALLARERAARAAAEASERRYRFLIKAIPQIVWAAQPGGEIDYFNPRWTESTGLSADRSLGRDWLEALHPGDVPRHLEHWGRALSSGEVYALDLRLRGVDGLFRWHLARALPVRDHAGRLTRWLGTFTEIDNQKRAEGALAFLAQASAALASTLDYETTLAGVARLAVPHVADWCVVDMVEPDGSLRRLAVAHADPSKAELVWDLARRQRSDPDEPFGPSRVLRSGRTEFAPEVSDAMLVAAALDDEHLAALRRLGLASYICTPLVARGRALGAITMGMADSGRRYATGDLPLAEDLARRAAVAVDNARLHSQAQEALRDAEAANRAKDEFLAVLSHELRTPLTPVLASASAMLDDPETPEVRPTLEMTRRNIELEARLIDDLLDVTRISQGKLRLATEVVDAHALILRAVAICRTEIHAGGLRLDLDLGAGRHHVEADPARLQQVFWNLIKNAVKFTPTEGTITVSSRNEGEPARLLVAVADTGIGIEPRVLPRVFDAFEQGENAAHRRFGGLGLGLAICRSVVEAHGGRLQAASAGVGRGSTFTIELATTETAAAAPKPEEMTPSPPRRSLRILLVEDNLDTLTVMARLLRRRGYEVEEAENVTRALEIADRSEFDLVVSDIGLPDGSGLDLIRRLRARRSIKGIALSGFGRDDDLRQSEEAGFAAHLTKPVDFPRLEALIQQVAAGGDARLEGFGPH